MASFSFANKRRAGYVHAVEVETGVKVWSKKIFAGNDFSRTSPAYDANTGYVIIGQQLGAKVYALRATTGGTIKRQQTNKSRNCLDIKPNQFSFTCSNYSISNNL
jgi:outer membrane protein assembly factor BamB